MKLPFQARCLCTALALSLLPLHHLRAQTTDIVHSDFAARCQLPAMGQAREAVALAKTPEARAALEFLYAYMALPDVADYAPEFYVEQVECALRARREMAWGSQIPDREWRHFVLPVRVNNEHLDTFRTTCYAELRDRVRGLSMYEAVLEVNHWCHEHVTYQPSDSRTSPPLSSMRSAIGRCGEESTYTVAALRAVGIPARQVYTPRWAHTDDNHAWVEAWVDGKWYFLGACEPEPVLNLGWFNAPASRGMLMHTKVFGRYDGPEDVMSRTNCFTEINVTDGYARTAPATVQVVGTDGQPAAGVRIDFKVYNYAELFTVLSTKTDNQGRARITAGIGDLVAWASDGTHFGLAKITPGTQDVTTLRLAHKAGERFDLNLDITPPRGENNLPALTDEQIAENTRRLSREDSIRMAYVGSFPTEQQVRKTLADTPMTDAAFQRLMALVRKSRGNSAAVLSLYRQYGTRALSLLEILTDKDLRDFDPAVVGDHILHTDLPSAQSAAREAETMAYVASPRIANEHLTPWRSYMQRAFAEKEMRAFAKEPQRIVAWIRKNIQADKDWNPLRLWLSPESAHRLRHADVRSMGALFVAIARTAGIPARINAVDGRVQYKDKDQQWRDVTFGQQTPAADKPAVATTALRFTPRDGMENPKYYTHFTLSRLADGMPQLQEYPEEDDWQHQFAGGREMPTGNYVLTSGTRMADGGVLARLSFFPVTENRASASPTQTETLVMRQDTTRVQVIGRFGSENRFYDAASQTERSLLSVTGRGYYALALLRAGHEPSNHILHDLEREAEALERWGRPILLLFPSRAELERFNQQRSEFTRLPSTVHFGVDEGGVCLADLIASGLVHSNDLPIVIIADTFDRVVLRTQGYTIGIGERIARTAQQIGK